MPDESHRTDALLAAAIDVVNMSDNLPPGVTINDLEDDLHFVILDDDENEIVRGEMRQEISNDDE